MEKTKPKLLSFKVDMDKKDVFLFFFEFKLFIAITAQRRKFGHEKITYLKVEITSLLSNIL